MPRWISITIDDLNDQKLGPLVEALRTKGLATGQDDPTPRLTQAVVDRVRRKIASHSTNRLDADGTRVPAGLKLMCVELIYAELKGHLEEPLTEDERRKLTVIEADLNRIASGADTIEQPDDPIEAPVEDSSGNPSITCGRRDRLNREKGL